MPEQKPQVEELHPIIASLERTVAQEGMPAARHRATSILASRVLGREFGESVESYYARRPDLAREKAAIDAWLNGEIGVTPFNRQGTMLAPMTKLADVEVPSKHEGQMMLFQNPGLTWDLAAELSTPLPKGMSKEQFRAEIDRRKELAKSWLNQNVSAASGASVVQLESRDGRKIIIFPSSYEGHRGEWQLSFIGQDGVARGHENYASLEEAVQSASGTHRLGAAAHPGEFIVTETRGKAMAQNPPLEIRDESASSGLRAMIAQRFKGVRTRPADNSYGHCVPAAAKQAFATGKDYYVVPTA